MIILHPKTSVNYAPLIINPLPGSETEALPVRVTRTQTIDGDAVTSHFGRTNADRTIIINAELTAAENVTLAGMMDADAELYMATAEGLFLGAVESREGEGGTVSIRFLVDTFYPPVTESTTSQASIDQSEFVAYRNYLGSETSTLTGYFYLGNYTSGHYPAWIGFVPDIPQGSTITSAKLTLTADANDSSTTVNSIIDIHDADDSSEPSTMAILYGYPTAGAGVDWDDVEAMTNGETYDTPDITSLIQAIVDRPGYAAGNTIGIIITSAGTTDTADRKITATPLTLDVSWS